MKFSKSACAAIVAFGLAGCADTMDRVSQMSWLEVGGALGGTMVGGYVGSQFGGGFGQTLFMTTGVLVGGSFGYAAARSLGVSDQVHYDTTVRQALRTSSDGDVVRWTNPKTGRRGIVRTVSTYRHSTGQQCRTYRASVVFDDGVFSGGGTACQMADGTWAKFHDKFS